VFEAHIEAARAANDQTVGDEPAPELALLQGAVA
jgi:hypothetical protein